MSTTSTLAGISIKIKEEHQNIESLVEIAKILGYSDDQLEEPKKRGYFDVSDAKINKWGLGCDYNRKHGFIFPTENEYEAFDIDTKLTLEDINRIIGELMDIMPVTYIDKNASTVSIFSMLYYNGSDRPLVF